MPMVYCSCGDVADVTSSFLGTLQPSLVLFEAVGLTQAIDGYDAAVELVRMPRLERVDLLE